MKLSPAEHRLRMDQQGCRLTRGKSASRRGAALEGRDLLLYRIAGRVGKARVDALCRHIEQGTRSLRSSQSGKWWTARSA